MTQEQKEQYYGLESAGERQSFLEALAQDEDTALRLKWLRHRRYTIKPLGETDVFMRAWMTLLTDAQTRPGLFGGKQRRKRLEEAMADLGLDGWQTAGEAERAVLRDEWTDYTRVFLEVTMGSHSYTTTLFSIIPLKKEDVVRKISTEIELVTRIYPEQMGMTERFAPFTETVIAETLRSVKGSAEILAPKA